MTPAKVETVRRGLRESIGGLIRALEGLGGERLSLARRIYAAQEVHDAVAKAVAAYQLLEASAADSPHPKG